MRAARFRVAAYAVLIPVNLAGLFGWLGPHSTPELACALAIGAFGCGYEVGRLRSAR